VDSFDQLTTKQVVYTWVRSVTGRERLADLPALTAQPRGFSGTDVCPPTYFISHAWNGKVRKLLDTIEDFLSNALDTTAVWIDFVAINQNNCSSVKSDSEALDYFVQAFGAVMKACHGGTLVVVDMKNCNPATRWEGPEGCTSHPSCLTFLAPAALLLCRIWCVFEWDQTLHLHGPDGLHMHGMDAEDLARIVDNIDVAKADYTKESDFISITGDIVKHHGSLTAFDTTLKLQLLLDPLSYKVDLEQLSRRSEGTEWKFDAVQEWLDRPEKSRALCVLAGAGTGKSTISAALCQKILGRREPGGWRGPVTAFHFLKHNDRRRLEPVRIVKSLAFQLESR
jgi:hypothetical protein